MMKSKKVVAVDKSHKSPLRHITLSDELYEIGHQIGRGAHSSVHTVKDQKGHSLVVKVYSPDTKSTVWKHEALMLRKFSSPWTVALHAAFEYKGQGYVLMEHGGVPIGRCKFEEEGAKIAKHVARYLLGGLQLFHSNGYVHNDINPQNLVVQVHENHILGAVKIIDLAFLRSSKDANSNAAPVALWMPPPECFKSACKHRTTATDVYHAALVLLQIAIGDTLEYTTCEILSNKPALDASSSKNSFIKRLASSLSLNPSERPTAVELWRLLA